MHISVPWHLVYSVIEPSSQSVLDQFHHPKKETIYPLAYNPYNSPSPKQTLLCFLSLQFYLFWTFHINEIKYVEQFYKQKKPSHQEPDFKNW